MKNILIILFGKKWYIPLYLLSYFWYFIFPGGVVTFLLKDNWELAKQGGDTSGSLGMVMPLIFTPLAIMPVLFISSILWLITLKDYGVWLKIFIVFGISILIPILLGLLSLAISSEFNFFLYYGMYFLMFFLHLFMLYKFVNRK